MQTLLPDCSVPGSNRQHTSRNGSLHWIFYAKDNSCRLHREIPKPMLSKLSKR